MGKVLDALQVCEPCRDAEGQQPCPGHRRCSSADLPLMCHRVLSPSVLYHTFWRRACRSCCCRTCAWRTRRTARRCGARRWRPAAQRPSRPTTSAPCCTSWPRTCRPASPSAWHTCGRLFMLQGCALSCCQPQACVAKMCVRCVRSAAAALLLLEQKSVALTLLCQADLHVLDMYMRHAGVAGCSGTTAIMMIWR